MFRHLIALFLLAILAACGGGGSEPLEPPPAFITNAGLRADYGYVVFEIQSRQGATPKSVYIDLRPSLGTYIDGAVVCIRESGSSSSCGEVGTTRPQIIRASGGKFVFDVSNLRSVMTLGRVYQLDLEILIDNYPYYWRSTDSLQLSIEYIEYFFDGFVETVDYRRSSAMSTMLYLR